MSAVTDNFSAQVGSASRVQSPAASRPSLHNREQPSQQA